MATTSFQNIPFDFLAEWAKSHTDKTPELKYVSTLAGKDGFETVGDIFNPALKACKRLNELRDALTSFTSELEAEYELSSTVHVLPSTPGLPADKALAEFISEYATVRESQLSKTRDHHTAAEIKAGVFRLYHCPKGTLKAEINGLGYVADALGITSERVRQILVTITKECREILLGGTVDKVAAATSLSDWYKSIDAATGSASTLAAFRAMTGFDGRDPYTERFLTDMLDLTVSTDKNREPMVSKNSLVAFSHSIGKVVKYFRDAALPVSETDFKVFLKKTFKDEEIRKTLFDFVMSSKDYIKAVDADGGRTIALTWENLEFIPSEVARILYDNMVFTVKDAWSKDQLVAEYNKLAVLHRMDTISRDTAGIFRHSLVMALGKSGYYKIKGYGETFTDGQEYARQYVLKHGEEGTLEEFLKECEADGYIHLYSGRTMESFFYQARQPLTAARKAAKPQFSPAELLRATCEVLKDNADGLQVSKLKKVVDSRLKAIIPEQTFRQLMNKASGDAIDLTPRGKKCLVATLRAIDPDTFDFEAYNPHSREVAYRKLVVNTAVDELRRAENHKMRMKDLVAVLKKLIPSDIAPNNVYKVFLDDSLFIKTTEGTGKGSSMVQLNPDTYKELFTDKAEMPKTAAAPSSATAAAPAAPTAKVAGYSWHLLRTIMCGQFKKIALRYGMNAKDILDEMYTIMCRGEKDLAEGDEFQRVLSLLYKFYTSPTSPADRELLCIKVVLGMEPFLKALYRKVEGTELYVKGLGTAVTALEERYYLPNETDGTEIGKAISSMVGKIISSRNHLHENFEGFSTCSDINWTTDFFLKFYFLVAAYSLYYVE